MLDGLKAYEFALRRAVEGGDATRVMQILSNFVGNAVKFSEQGEVVVRAALADEDSVSVLLRLEVVDVYAGSDHPTPGLKPRNE